MQMSVEYLSLATGVQGLFVENKSFHTTLVSFQFYLPLSRETVAENAIALVKSFTQEA